MPLTGIITLIDTLFLFTIGFNLLSTYKKTRQITVLHLALSLIMFAIFTASLALPHIYWKNPEQFMVWAHWALILGFPFLYLHMALASLVPSALKYPSLKWPLFFGILLIGAIAIVVLILFLGGPIHGVAGTLVPIYIMADAFILIGSIMLWVGIVVLKPKPVAPAIDFDKQWC